MFPSASSGYECRATRPGLPAPPFQITTDGVFTTTRLDRAHRGQYNCTSNDINGTLTIDLTVAGKLCFTNTYVLSISSPSAHLPHKPVILNSTLTRDNKLNITWTDNTTATRPVERYVLEIITSTQSRARQVSDEDEETMTVTTNSEYHITDDDYDRQKQYMFRVKAVNNAGESDFSSPHIHRDLAITAPLAGQVAPWGIALIVLLVLLCCCACCWWIICVLLLCCFYRRKRRKVYKAEERGRTACLCCISCCC